MKFLEEKIMANIKKEYERWLANATADTDVAAELKTLDDTQKQIFRGIRLWSVRTWTVIMAAAIFMYIS